MDDDIDGRWDMAAGTLVTAQTFYEWRARFEAEFADQKAQEADVERPTGARKWGAAECGGVRWCGDVVMW